MNKAAEFAAFLAFYHTVVTSEHLTVPEKVALIEAAYGEFSSRNQPHPYDRIAQRLAENPWREAQGEKQPASPARGLLNRRVAR